MREFSAALAVILIFAALVSVRAPDVNPTCDSGYSLQTGYCYRKVATKKSWANAKLDCEGTSDWLATVYNAADNLWIFQQYAVGSGNSAWIGITDAASEGTWIWTHGETATYRDWQSGYPRTGTTGATLDCGWLGSGDETWNDAACTDTRYAICQSNANCAAGYFFNAGNNMCRTNPTASPTASPISPTVQPTAQPINPSVQPTAQPVIPPTGQPSRQPISRPTGQPSRQPSSQPSRQPVSDPSAQPTRQPSRQPVGEPTGQPSAQPSRQPFARPSSQPSAQPSRQPSFQPVNSPTSQPSVQPSRQPVGEPSGQPSSQPSRQPFARPSSQPSAQPSRQPSFQPVNSPTSQPSMQPSRQPVGEPSGQPSCQPSRQPFARPSSQPSGQPSCQPSAQPLSSPTSQPSVQPSRQPNSRPSSQPSAQPSLQPFSSPTSQPSGQPSQQPSAQPFSRPTTQPSAQPSTQPSRQPSRRPSQQPSTRPTVQPTGSPSRQPSRQPSCQPSSQPSRQPVGEPTAQPSRQPSVQPTCQPSQQPTVQPSGQPSSQPISGPSAQPSGQPSTQPSNQPSRQPSGQPSRKPTTQPSEQPSAQPSRQPSTQPSTQPSVQPSVQPSARPSRQPSSQPSTQPSTQPTEQPSTQPSRQPSNQPSCQPTSRPTVQPTGQPSRQPSARPSIQPSSQPSRQPTSRPSGQPSRQPSNQPSGQPTSRPTRQPTGQPSMQPSSRPSVQPSTQPSRQPTNQPSGQPSVQPSRQPSCQPTSRPTEQPTTQPSRQPSAQPSAKPTRQPSVQPSGRPSVQPTGQPSRRPTGQPSSAPTCQPSRQPSQQPSVQPSRQPSTQPSMQPSGQPSVRPTVQPSVQPSAQPSTQPSARPSTQPSAQPSRQPSGQPSRQPSCQPTAMPTTQPSRQPTAQPSLRPSSQPSSIPSSQPSSQPSRQPSGRPSSVPSTQPSRQPTSLPTVQPSAQPSSQPSTQPTMQPSTQPSQQPSSKPSAQPSRQPSGQPSGQPSVQPSGQPSTQPTRSPTCQPTNQPSRQPSVQPTTSPSSQPTMQPSMQPSRQPTEQPSRQPSVQPSAHPSGQPSRQPSGQPSGQPSSQPSSQPTMQPSNQPSRQPSEQPSGQPSAQPTASPSTQPSNQPSRQPSGRPSDQPSAQPSLQPSGQPSGQPSMQPSTQPSAQPSSEPSMQPSAQPTEQPTTQPSSEPSRQPSAQPSAHPSGCPTAQPSEQPSAQPSEQPSAQPSQQPTGCPSMQPSMQPTAQPTVQPSAAPSSSPSAQPSSRPSSQPSCQPSMSPTGIPSAQPSAEPTCIPSGQPSAQPSSEPTGKPTMQPSTVPSVQPSMQPSSQPTTQPSAEPSMQPSSFPSCQPSTQPSANPSSQPSSRPTAQPTEQPSAEPSSSPSVQPSALPSTQPTERPTAQPSDQPSSRPSSQPSGCPSSQPSNAPSLQPSAQPSSQPTQMPSSQPSGMPSRQPSNCPSAQPSQQPSGNPTRQPTSAPSSQPSACPTVQPSAKPSSRPSSYPSVQPSSHPSSQPIAQPSVQPSSVPSVQPSRQPSSMPTGIPTTIPTRQPSNQPSAQPTVLPTSQPSACPSTQPTDRPSGQPSSAPSVQPSRRPTSQPSCQPSSRPSAQPSSIPSCQPSRHPTIQPSSRPSSQPSHCPSARPSRQPSSQPSQQPSVQPSVQPFGRPTAQPSRQPTVQPSTQPSRQPSRQPFSRPSAQPSSSPTLALTKRIGLVSAVFRADGMTVLITLNRPTNLAGQTGRNSFTCGKVLVFPMANSTVCSWNSTSSMVIHSSTIMLGTAVMLTRNSGLGVNCTDGSICSQSYLDTFSVIVAGSAAPQIPVIPVFTTANTSSCSWQLDFTQVSGNAGRAWKSIAFNVTSLLISNTSALRGELYRQFALSPLINLPNQRVGDQLILTVSLCNFLGGCASRTMVTNVLDHVSAPVVSVTGSRNRTIRASDRLSVTVDAYSLRCSGQRDRGLLMTWRMALVGGSVPPLLSQSKESNVYALPGRSLLANRNYVLTVVAADLLNNANATASVLIQVLPSELVASIKPSAQQQLQVGSTLTLNSSSYDPDGSPLFYRWSCNTKATASFAVGMVAWLPCVLNLNGTGSAVTVMAAPGSSVGSVSAVYLFVQEIVPLYGQRRNASAMVEVKLIGNGQALVNISSSLTEVAYVNSGSALTLKAAVKSAVACNASWIMAGALTSSNSFIVAKSIAASRQVDMSMSIPSAVLMQGSYLFTLSCGTSSSSISVMTNSPPKHGRFRVDPDHGFAVNTTFLLAASLWMDSDLPLAYTYSFLSQGAVLLVRSKSAIPTAYVLLPFGGPMDALNVSLVVEDAFNAKISIQQAVTSRPLPSAVMTTLLSNYLSLYVGTSALNELQNVVSVATAVINVVNCTRAPNCASLHRSACSMVANTCGACLDGYSSLQSSDYDNNPCLSNAAVAAYSSAPKTCNPGPCSAWQTCNNATKQCVDISKTCNVPSCSSHGACSFVSRTNSSKVFPSCPLLSATCEPVCICNAGYGGADCSITTAALATEQAMRALLLNGLVSTLNNSDSTESSLTSAAVSLAAIIRTKYDLANTAAARQASAASGQLLSKSLALNVPLALNVADILDPVNAALASYPSNTTASSSSSSASMDLLGSFLGTDQAVSNAVYDTFRVDSVTIDSPTGGSSTVNVPITLTEQEKLLQSTGQLQLPSVAVSTTGNGTASVTVIIMDQSAWQSNSTLLSSVVTVKATGVAYVDVTMPKGSFVSPPAINFSIECPPRIRILKNFTCIDSGSIMKYQCEGQAGVYKGSCPVLSSTCNSLDVPGQKATARDQCYVVNATETTITCRCTVGTGGTGVVAAALVANYVGNDLSKTFAASSAFGSASAVSEAYIILTLFSSLWGCSFAVIAYFGWGYHEKKKHIADEKVEAIKQRRLSFRNILFVGKSKHRKVAFGKCDGIVEDKEPAALAREKLGLYILSIFPTIFDAKTAVIGLKEELAKNHLYYNFFFRLDKSRSPILAVVKMLTIQAFLLFLLALLYDLNYPDDDGSCPSFTTINDCLARKYMLDATQSYCKWDEEFNSCLYAQPAFSITTAMYVSMMISIATCLAMEPLEYLIDLLAAPAPGAKVAPGKHVPSSAPEHVGQASSRYIPVAALTAHLEAINYAKLLTAESHVLLERRFTKRLHLVKRMALKLPEVEHPMLVGAAASTAQALLAELTYQREVLQGEHRKQFDKAWGLHSHRHSFLQRDDYHWWYGRRVYDVQVAVQKEIALVQKDAHKLIEELEDSSDADKGFEIMQAFIKDLLGRNSASARIFTSKTELDFEKMLTSSTRAKVLICIFLIALNILFAGYTMLKGYSKGLHWQQDYLRQWGLQLILDVFLFETVQCMWLHCAVPGLVAKEVNAVYAMLLQTVEHLCNTAHYEKHGVCLNAPDYLFVSNRLADAYPHLIESTVVKAYSTHFPGNAGHAWLDKLHKIDKQDQRRRQHGVRSWLWKLRSWLPRSFLIALLVQVACAPMHLQNLIIRALQPVLFSGLSFLMYTLIAKPVFFVIFLLGMAMLIGALMVDYYRVKQSILQHTDLEIEEDAVGGERLHAIAPAPEEGSDMSYSMSDSRSGYSSYSSRRSSRSLSRKQSESESEESDEDSDHNSIDVLSQIKSTGSDSDLLHHARRIGISESTDSSTESSGSSSSSSSDTGSDNSKSSRSTDSSTEDSEESDAIADLFSGANSRDGSRRNSSISSTGSFNLNWLFSGHNSSESSRSNSRQSSFTFTFSETEEDLDSKH